MIPTILKGCTSQQIALSLPADFDPAGWKLHVSFNGVTRSFDNLAAGGMINLQFSADETAAFPVGTERVLFILSDSEGHVAELPWAKIKVTDSRDEYAAAINSSTLQVEVKDALIGVAALPPRWTEDDMRTKINEIIARLGGAVGMLLALALPAFADVLTVQTAPKGTIYNDEQVVTNVTLDASGLATKGEVPGTVSNIVTKTYVEELGISGGGGGGATNYDNLSNKPSINGVTLSGNKTAAELELATAEQGAKADSAYQKPQAGIPASDMAQAVQTSLGKADTALQKTGDTMTGLLDVPNIIVGSTVSHSEDPVVTRPYASATIGEKLRVYNTHEVAIGYCNSPTVNLTIFSIGVGDTIIIPTPSGTIKIDKPQNAVEVTNNSNVYIFNVGGYDGTNPTDAQDLATVVNGKAPLASPAFTGTPTAPTPAAADNSTNVATTAFVKTAISGISVTPLSGHNFNFATTQGVMDALKATIEALGGTVTNAPTPPAQNNQTQGE